MRSADARDLLQPVADVDERDALAAQRVDLLEQVLGLLRRRARRSARRGSAAARPASAPWRSRPAAARRPAALATMRVGGTSQAEPLQLLLRAAVHLRAVDAAARIGSRPTKMFSAIDRSGSSRISWWIRPMPASSASAGRPGAYGCPCHVIVPCRSGTTPAMMSDSVDLPAPFSPSKATHLSGSDVEAHAPPAPEWPRSACRYALRTSQPGCGRRVGSRWTARSWDARSFRCRGCGIDAAA